VWSMNGGLQGLGWPALSEIVMRWFEPAKRGSVWSTCTVAGNVAKSVAPVSLAFLSTTFGWRAALIGPGAAALGTHHHA
jgi:OPA family sugar phosphate sensor protein UhpC-like MFS transporter